jgi:hypothetical protein
MITQERKEQGDEESIAFCGYAMEITHVNFGGLISHFKYM